MSYSKLRLEAMKMKKLPLPEQYEQVIYQMLPYPNFVTGFNDVHFYKSQQFHWYSSYNLNVAQIY